MNLFYGIRMFFVDCWNAYFNWMSNIFSEEIAKILTVVLGFAILATLFVLIVRWFDD